MKLKRLFWSVSAVAVLGAGQIHAEEDKTPMGNEMSAASKQLKLLRKIPKDDFKAGADAVRKAHEAVLKSMTYVPALIEEMPEGAEKQKALADSRRLLGLSYAALCELEIAYLEADSEKIAATMSKIKDLKKEGHKKYTDD